MWTFIGSYGTKKRQKFVAWCSLFQLNETCVESEQDKVFFRIFPRKISSKVVHILELKFVIDDKRFTGRSEIIVLRGNKLVIFHSLNEIVSVF